jgi:hypothetical protein
MVAAAAPRIPIEAPTADVLAESSAAQERRIELHIRAASGTLAVRMRALGTPVTAASIDGRPIDTSRYRWRAQEWSLGYTAPPDSGFTLALTVPAASRPMLELIAQSPGLPTLAGVHVPPRPAGVVASQAGDLTVVRRLISF